MDLTKYLIVLVMLCLEGGETGGGGKHHDHVRLHIPEFHHHDHHKKVITIHHHHHKPKKEHHHHHHHHQKPHIPHGNHFSHHHKKVHLKTQTVSKGTGHGSHGHHGHHKHHGHHGHHGHHHGHHGHHGHGHHHDAPVVPTYGYTPSAIPSYEDDYSSYSPAVPSYDSGIPTTGYTAPQIPHVHGISHTVKQVKVFDSLPGAVPSKGISHGYEVTEQGDEGDEAFISVNNLQNTYPATFGYIRGAASQPTNDPFGGISSQNSIPQTHDPFGTAPEPTSLSDGIEAYPGIVQNDPFSSSAPTQGIGIPSVSPSADFPVTYQESGFDGEANSFPGSDVEGPSFIAHEENNLSDETPISFTREAGIQQTTKTGNVETVVY